MTNFEEIMRHRKRIQPERLSPEEFKELTDCLGPEDTASTDHRKSYKSLGPDFVTPSHDLSRAEILRILASPDVQAFLKRSKERYTGKAKPYEDYTPE